MDKKTQIKHLWKECLKRPTAWIEMYLDRVYTDDNALTHEEDGRIVSALMLSQYDFLFHGQTTTMGNISCAATLRKYRGRGIMTALTIDALRLSRQRGDMICALIPSARWIYFFYDMLGFSTVFHVDRQRFTSLHAFHGGNEEAYKVIDNTFDDAVYDAMHRMEMDRGCGVLHSKRDFLNIIDDLHQQPDAHFVAMTDEQGAVCSMAWAVKRHDVVEVRELLGNDDDSRQAAMRTLRSYYPDAPFQLLAPAESNNRHLYARGMARIVNVEKCLSIIAQANEHWLCAIRIADSLIPENTHTYLLRHGRVEIADSYSGRLDFDVTVEVLAAMIFSDAKIADILSFPAHRAHIALMLE